MTRDLRFVAETGSTNDDMAALAEAGAGEGVWLRTARQTGGRGRQGRAWGSCEGNLLASTAVRLRPGDPSPGTLALVAAVALHQTLLAYGVPAPMLKWPNDVLAGGSKLSGILLEKRAGVVVVGFGVNLAAHPAGLDRAVTSLPTLGLAAPDPHGFLADLADAFARWLARWRGEGLEPVRAAWLAAAHPRGTPLSARTSAEATVEGLFDGLEADGALRLRLADGSARVMHAGDVFLL